MKPKAPENLVVVSGWPKMYAVSEFEAWKRLPLWERLRFWPDGKRRLLGWIIR